MAKPQERRYLCIICMKQEIVEQRMEHRRILTEAPDRPGHDYAEYTDYRVVGGKMLLQRQTIPWNYSPVPATHVGGICEDCLKNIEPVRILQPYIDFS